MMGLVALNTYLEENIAKQSNISNLRDGCYSSYKPKQVIFSYLDQAKKLYFLL